MVILIGQVWNDRNIQLFLLHQKIFVDLFNYKKFSFEGAAPPPFPFFWEPVKIIGKVTKLLLPVIKLFKITSQSPTLTLIICYRLSTRSPILKINYLNRDSTGGTCITCTWIPYRALHAVFLILRFILTKVQEVKISFWLCEKRDNSPCTNNLS